MSQNKKIFFLAIIILIVLLLLYSLFFLVPRQAQTTPTPTTSGSPLVLPTGGTRPSGTPIGRPTGSTFGLRGNKGEVTVKNFYQASTSTISPNGNVILNDTSDYFISFHPDDQSFSIAIQNSNFNTARAKAEQVFLNDLNISQEQACQLNVSLFVPRNVDESLSGQNYGLSFCNEAD